MNADTRNKSPYECYIIKYEKVYQILLLRMKEIFKLYHKKSELVGLVTDPRSLLDLSLILLFAN